MKVDGAAVGFWGWPSLIWLTGGAAELSAGGEVGAGAGAALDSAGALSAGVDSAGAEEAAAELAGPAVADSVGTLTPTAPQNWTAYATANSWSDGLQDAKTQVLLSWRKVGEVQMHVASVTSQPVLPMASRAQVCYGIRSVWS